MDQQAQAVPQKRPVPVPIDPKKFIGGENIEKLKSLLRDVDEFTSSVKDKSKQLSDTLDLFRENVVKFGDVIDTIKRVAEKMEGKNGQAS
jgi:hypothetical protein